ncbi:SUF system NifU family Fe-S cluster assembly protein [Ligilactobacillus pobuzihii]|uniref:Fe-S cluster assembly sulfur transfer protein SufU n=1 Tax=Ligilactobacillus pobuzihii TaxID=449659 RepID=UPI0019D2DE7C|nr:SUF system NifU family Fe-S cluster assembly protein [Ligilactobacillus pobuzihii]MBN7273688.1 SUF system NifU family Fe-S cluster assembly protein [Ligilactobacillus pobuzihii]HIZ95309.1 SUF system NifU family Fe-S cluster assembly protein [Candidatus Ligilactobacillus excrementavium]
MALSKLSNLYRQVIMDHAKHPHNNHELDQADHELELRNPTCGDVLTVQLKIADNTVIDAAYTGTGCTISQASASMMTDQIKGKTTAEVEQMVLGFSDMVMGKDVPDQTKLLGEASILQSVAQFPARIKCATLAWKAAYQAIEESESND